MSDPADAKLMTPEAYRAARAALVNPPRKPGTPGMSDAEGDAWHAEQDRLAQAARDARRNAIVAAGDARSLAPEAYRATLRRAGIRIR